MTTQTKPVENDTLQKFLFERHALRGQFVRINASFSAVLSKHEYPQMLQELLGQALCASALLSSNIKFDGLLTFQCQSRGPVSMLVAECNHHYQLRGLARWNESFAETLPLSELFPNGQLIMTIDPETSGSRYQAIVEMKGNSIADYLTNYFIQSEQLQTKLYLVSQGNRAAGILLQALPTTEKTPEPLDWEHFIHLTNTLTPQELLSQDNETLLRKLYHGEEIRLYEPSPVCFRCSCTRERLENAIRQLGRAEVEEIIAEQGSLKATCEFCNQSYEFDRVDIEEVLQDSGSKTPVSDKKH